MLLFAGCAVLFTTSVLELDIFVMAGVLFLLDNNKKETARKVHTTKILPQRILIFWLGFGYELFLTIILDSLVQRVFNDSFRTSFY